MVAATSTETSSQYAFCTIERRVAQHFRAQYPSGAESPRVRAATTSHKDREAKQR
jgi:hypothetical protein